MHVCVSMHLLVFYGGLFLVHCYVNHVQIAHILIFHDSPVLFQLLALLFILYRPFLFFVFTNVFIHLFYTI